MVRPAGLCAGPRSGCPSDASWPYGRLWRGVLVPPQTQTDRWLHPLLVQPQARTRPSTCSANER